jgi:hypothetical protein
MLLIEALEACVKSVAPVAASRLKGQTYIKYKFLLMNNLYIIYPYNEEI